MHRALINTLEAYNHGVRWLDSTVNGLGRGPGNTKTEDLVFELKDINDVDWKNVKDTVYLDALACKTAWWKNYDHFTKLFDDVKDAFMVDADTNVFDNGV